MASAFVLAFVDVLNSFSKVSCIFDSSFCIFKVSFSYDGRKLVSNLGTFRF